MIPEKVTITIETNPGLAMLIAAALNDVSNGDTSVYRILGSDGRDYLHQVAQNLSDQVANQVKDPDPGSPGS